MSGTCAKDIGDAVAGTLGEGRIYGHFRTEPGADGTGTSGICQTEQSGTFQHFCELTRLSEKGYSPLANYVYFHYVRRCGVKQTPTGTVYGSTEDRANPNNLLVSAWNDMVEMNESLFRYLCGNKGYDGFEFDKSMLEEINTMGI